MPDKPPIPRLDREQIKDALNKHADKLTTPAGRQQLMDMGVPESVIREDIALGERLALNAGQFTCG